MAILKSTFVLSAGLALLLPVSAEGARLKDLVDVEGFRDNPLVGVGLVVGLSRTGDSPSSIATRQPLASIMQNLGSQVDPRKIRSRNVAIVMVTANLPPFSRPGVRFDVTVSSIGDASSLQGGSLIATALKGIDRRVYAIAQGPLTVGGFEARASSGTLRRKNHVTVARIAGGGMVEREVPQVLPTDKLRLLLKEPDFTTAKRIVEAIGAEIGETSAQVRDPGVVEIEIPETYRERVVHLVATIEGLEASPDAPARVVVNERTGVIVVGASVTLEPVAIAYGGLHIQIDESFQASQPTPFGSGDTVVIPQSTLDVHEQPGAVEVMPKATTLEDLSKALNALQLKPRDLVSILQALKAAGALRAEIRTL